MDINIFFLPECSFHRITGYYCFGCGGTRAVNAFLHGHFIKSVLYHPFVFYFFIVAGIFFVTTLLKTVTNGKVRALKPRPLYLHLAAVIIILQCIIKNYLLFKYQIAL